MPAGIDTTDSGLYIFFSVRKKSASKNADKMTLNLTLFVYTVPSPGVPVKEWPLSCF